MQKIYNYVVESLEYACNAMLCTSKPVILLVLLRRMYLFQANPMVCKLQLSPAQCGGVFIVRSTKKKVGITLSFVYCFTFLPSIISDLIIDV